MTKRIIGREVQPYRDDFPNQLESYLEQIRGAIRLHQHHDQRRQLFLNYLRLAYGVEPEEIELEHKVKALNVKGYIDALYRYVIFEFKTDLERERPTALSELKKYLKSRPRAADYLCILTDGLKFELFNIIDSTLQSVRVFELDEKDAIGSYRALDSILFVSRQVTPRSIDITTKFGSESAVFRQSLNFLKEMFDPVSKRPSVVIKYREWSRLLSKVYGEAIGDHDLFLRHTYLTMFARLLLTNALFPDSKKTTAVFRGIMDGSYFARNNLPNLAEPDFFSWALETPSDGAFLVLLSQIDSYFSSFRLSDISEDLLKEIYQELIGPASRHSLGEYYTPDWVTDVAFQAIAYQGGSVLDPACGSGSFLLGAIRVLRSQGVRGRRLVETVCNSIMGLDVHPLAVMMAKANIVLGLAREIKAQGEEVYLPIYMADTLLVSDDPKARSIQVMVSDSEAFHIPQSAIDRNADLDKIIDRIAAAASKCGDEANRRRVWKGLLAGILKDIPEREELFWKHDFNLFCKLIEDDRDTIWSYILKNAYRPTYIRKHKVDYVIGNPPWLAYRYIKDAGYRKVVKKLTIGYSLLSSKEVKLFTHIDTSTLFFVHCETAFLKPHGTIAFVMPKTTVLPAQQHLAFQARGISQIHDFSDVSPLFGVRCVLLVRRKRETGTKAVPRVRYQGTLPVRNASWSQAQGSLNRTKDTADLRVKKRTYSPYYPFFLQGASIVPRCFWFVQPAKDAALHRAAPYMESSDDALAEAKEPWKIKLEGRIERQFLFETVLGKGLLPFAVSYSEQVFLPIIKKKETFALASQEVLLECGHNCAADWLAKAEDLWTRLSNSERDLIGRLNYSQYLSKQQLDASFVLIYNTSGTNLTAAVYFSEQAQKKQSAGFVASHVTYYYYPSSSKEAYYLCAVLNSSVVNALIKELQPQGLYGERHICRRPFEACTIPRFDSKNSLHASLADLGEKCTQSVLSYIPHLKGRLGQMRLDVRRIIAGELAKIDVLVLRVLDEAGQHLSQQDLSQDFSKTDDLFRES